VDGAAGNVERVGDLGFGHVLPEGEEHDGALRAVVLSHEIHVDSSITAEATPLRDPTTPSSHETDRHDSHPSSADCVDRPKRQHCWRGSR
jgi:hypothetical protein